MRCSQQRSWRSEEHFDIGHRDAEFGVAQLVLGLALVHYFLTKLPSLPFRIVMYILCHDILENFELFFYLDFYTEEIATSLRETLNFGLLNSIETVIDYRDF